MARLRKGMQIIQSLKLFLVLVLMLTSFFTSFLRGFYCAEMIMATLSLCVINVMAASTSKQPTATHKDMLEMHRSSRHFIDVTYPNLRREQWLPFSHLSLSWYIHEGCRVHPMCQVCSCAFFEHWPCNRLLHYMSFSLCFTSPWVGRPAAGLVVGRGQTAKKAYQNQLWLTENWWKFKYSFKRSWTWTGSSESDKRPRSRAEPRRSPPDQTWAMLLDGSRATREQEGRRPESGRRTRRKRAETETSQVFPGDQRSAGRA